MRTEQLKYDLYPLSFPVGQPVEFTIRPLGKHIVFAGEYTIGINSRYTGWIRTRPTTESILCAPDADGCLRFTYMAEKEADYQVRLIKDGNCIITLWIYAVEDDLAGRYPFRGDFHVHTCLSDGQESPDTVCANYRRRGYDFISITDHSRYYPSLEAIEAFADVQTALNILPGEEIHLPGTPIHLVNVGGKYSINGLLDSLQNYTDTNGDLDKRRLDDSVSPPPVLTLEEYHAEIAQWEKEVLAAGFPEEATNRSIYFSSYTYAICLWAFNHIREAEGLGIYPHPYWNDIVGPEAFLEYLFENAPFDAFEVLGGCPQYSENGYMTAKYYDAYREGRVHAIVGSTDSHSCIEGNRHSHFTSTIVFAPANTREALIAAVKDRYSVAVDTLSPEYRLVGELRLQKYASFLMEHFYPLHDRQAAADGEMLCRYVQGEATAAQVETVSELAEKLLKKYILTK